MCALLVHIHQSVPNQTQNVFLAVLVSILLQEAVMYQIALIVLLVNLRWKVENYPIVFLVVLVHFHQMVLQNALLVLLDNIQIQMDLHHVPLVLMVRIQKKKEV
jgi:hypothetical protein